MINIYTGLALHKGHRNVRNVVFFLGKLEAAIEAHFPQAVFWSSCDCYYSS